MTATSDTETFPDLHPPRDVVWIARRLIDAGFDTWTVGGAVRDALTGGHPKDWDLATAARPAEMRRLFKRTVPVGIEHGTVGVLGRDGVMYEVTTFRRDVETDGRHARVIFADHVDEDLQRRDFTINAVAWHPVTHEVRDPHGGVPDLRARVLRTVGDPAERFREDRLRVLRALRFAGRFAMRIDEGTWDAARAAAPELTHLSAERVREELLKVLRQVDPPSIALRMYRDSGVLAVLLPELQACAGVPNGAGEEDVWTHTLRVVDAISPARAGLRMAALLHDAGKARTRTERDGRVTFPDHAAAGAATADAVMRRLKFSNAEIDTAVHLVAQHEAAPPADAPDPVLRRWLRRIGPRYLNDVFRLRIADLRAYGADADARRELVALWRRARREVARGTPLEIGDLAIGGTELRQLGLPPGRLYGEILRDLLERVTDDPALNERETLMGMVARRVS
ncbi:HD domain-containing protein [Longimicrobium terrae]|uniref:Putative nucleotidyltransferase with HDIG domain n=1 Tax=Longimicrobium terrae TaxID=1639882 RepID=A0A841GMF0_9BACT|nr:putative nucleotidyltransferase with HDIG domain [Longimicrobium terrae]MBB6069961.1 putative nucleotidyltransferase with HDIG domain [Longimicrobium terrae]NNC32872.1 CCA tRNA nucleotidyltransferase [Longimicrobium terrae]